MGRYFTQRLISAVGVLFMVSILVFGLISMLPGDAAIAMVGTEASAEDFARVRRALELDAPIHVRYVTWLSQVMRGNFGRSMITQQPVADLLRDRFAATVILAGAGMVIALVIGMLSGIIAGTRPRSLVDRFTTLLALFGNSMPVFWLGVMLVLLFSQQLQWLPTSGMQSAGRDDLADVLAHLILPALTIGLVATGPITRMVRSSMLEVLRQDYITVARAKGVREYSIATHHALRNALLPVTTVMGIQVGHLLGGAVVTETVFAWPGLGSQIYTAINNRDLPVVIGSVLLIAVTFVFVNLIVDTLYAYIDPRIRYG